MKRLFLMVLLFAMSVFLQASQGQASNLVQIDLQKLLLDQRIQAILSNNIIRLSTSLELNDAEKKHAVAEKDRVIAEKDRAIVEKDRVIRGKDNALRDALITNQLLRTQFAHVTTQHAAALRQIGQLQGLIRNMREIRR